ncbi:MAG: cell division protein FtsZ [Alphaproteobacteria bacterium]|nr:cell division protein FtsZ [Alphaproteobacteria bacterium]
MTVNLKLPDMSELNPRITVFGVGGAGGNAVNNMIRLGLRGVDFVVANTDAQALMASSAERRIQMGIQLTEGLGAGSRPEIGSSAAQEARDEIYSQIEGAHMVFITAGMGGGTGTGAAPVIASVAREQGILTVGVVTKPFQFEGQRRLRTAEAGIVEMQKHVDTLIVIPNQNLFRVANERTTFSEAFAMADQVLYSGVACITSVIVEEGLINLDFADVRAVMSEMGKAMMGTGEASGDKRAIESAEAAISNPLLDDVSMRGARGLLISISGGNDLTLFEVDEAATRIREEVDPDANIILGATFDDCLEGSMRVSVVATGIDAEELKGVEKKDRDTMDFPRKELAGGNVFRDHPQGEAKMSGGAQEFVKEGNNCKSSLSGKIEFEEHQILKDGMTLRPMRIYPDLSSPSSEKTASSGTPRRDNAVLDEGIFIPPVAARVDSRRPSMPQMEDFPLPAQNEMKARLGDATEMGIDVHKRKSGFFQRFVGTDKKTEGKGGNRDVTSSSDSNSCLPVSSLESSFFSGEFSERINRVGGESEASHKGEENLEIPAFLRRQAH